MPWRTDLLNPIPGERPAGADLRNDPITFEIREARREDDNLDQGDWAVARKTADWARVVKLTSEVLAERSKDLQMAVWLTEAMIRREGLGALSGGLDLLMGLLESFWDGVYPEADDEGDLSLRAAPLAWLGSKLDSTLKFAKITQAKDGDVDWFQYKESRLVMSEADCGEDWAKQEARKKQIAAGKTPPETADKAIEQTPKAFYKQLVASIAASLEKIRKLDQFGEEKFGDAAPIYSSLVKSLEEVRDTVQPILRKKLEADPDPVDLVAVAAASLEEAPSGDGPATLSLVPLSRGDAEQRLIGALHYLRRDQPEHPSAYLLVRAWRWSEVTAGQPVVDPKLLEAPSTAKRTQLKTLLLDGKWAELLDEAEVLAATPVGRGWLDLQRYVVTACERLGGGYQRTGVAIQAALAAYLRECPTLPSMTLMDDAPAANAETLAWLGNGHAPAGVAAHAPTVSAFERASATARSGSSQQAVALLMRELGQQRSARGRFECNSHLASILIESGQFQVALPIVEHLAAEIEAHKLEEWEESSTVAGALVLYYRCLAGAGGDEALRQSLYLRICRLDPLQAMQAAEAS